MKTTVALNYYHSIDRESRRTPSAEECNVDATDAANGTFEYNISGVRQTRRSRDKYSAAMIALRRAGDPGGLATEHVVCRARAIRGGWG